MADWMRTAASIATAVVLTAAAVVANVRIGETTAAAESTAPNPLMPTPVATEVVRFASLAEDAYRYPVTPEDKDWGHYEPLELVDILKIPWDVVEAMSSDGLAASLLDCPDSANLMLYSTSQQGYEAVRGSCTALAELVTRPDAAETLWRWYRSPEVRALKGPDHWNVFVEPLLHVLLTREEILRTASPALRAEIEAAIEPLTM